MSQNMEMEINQNHLSNESTYTFIQQCLSNCQELLTRSQPGFDTVYDQLIEYLKALRNICAKGKNFQNCIASSDIFQNVFELIWDIEHTNLTIVVAEPQMYSIKLLLWQLISNICANNTENLKIIWTKCNKVLIFCLSNEISAITDIQLMILYHLTKNYPNIFLQPNDVFNLIIKVWSNYLELRSVTLKVDFLHIFFEEFLCTGFRITPIYGPLEPENRILVLKYVSAYIRNGNPNNKIQKNLMEYLSKEFKKKSDCILKTDTSHLNEIHPKEVIALLDVIAIATGDEIYGNVYSNDHSLFLNIGSLLQALNDIGKNSENIFTPMEKLVDVAPNSNTNSYRNYESEVSYQLRTQLVRTLANLLYKNQINQQYAREMNIILAILNCTRMDARNPMLKEWSILAIRNACENCAENQELVSKLTKINDDSNNELNLEMGSLRIKPDA